MRQPDAVDSTGGTASISLIVPEDQLPCFYTLCQRGLRVPAQIGCTLQELLCGQFGLLPAYLQQRVKTLFLDGKPVDDPSRAFVRDGSIVALSAALPGLAGAALRRDGYLGLLRNSLTHREERSDIPLQDGSVTVRLFNLLIKEVGPILFGRGVLFYSRDLVQFFSGRSARFWEACRGAEMNGKEIAVKELANFQGLDRQDTILLRVEFRG